jgi:hypothetical protein
LTDSDFNTAKSGKLSMRKSVLVIVTGILLGWGAAFVVVYQLIRTSAEDGNPASLTAQAPTDREIDEIEPASGIPSE